MKIKKPVLRIAIAAAVGLAAGAMLEFAAFGVSFPILTEDGLLLGVAAGCVIELVIYWRSARHRLAQSRRLNLERLPVNVAEFIKLVVRKMRYRRKVRADVMAELAAHFEDALKDCKTDEERDRRAKQLIADFGDVKLLGVLLRRAKKRCRPLWRTIVARTFQTIGALFLCFILYCVYISLGEPTISINYIEQATRLARPAADEGLNAAPLYEKAIDAYKEPPYIQQEQYSYPVRFESRAKFKRRWRPDPEPEPEPEKRLVSTPLLVAIEGKDWIGDLSEEELSAMQQWIASNSEAIEYFRQAADKPHCWWHRRAKDNIVLVALMPELAELRKLTQLTCWRAKLKAYNGDIENALQDLLSCHRTGMHFKGPRSLIEQMVGIAIQSLAVRSAFVILSNQQIDDSLLKDFQDELDILMARDFHTMDYTVKSFMGLDFIQRCYTDNGQGSGHLIPGRVREFWKLMDHYETENEFAEYARFLAMSVAGADREQMTREFEKYYSGVQQWAPKTPWQLKHENVDTDMGMYEWSDFRRARYWPLTVFAPALGKASELSHRTRVQTEALITTVALTRYKRIYGDYPESLYRLLEADLLKKLPMDPYSDKPLVYKPTADGFTLYSLGADFDDDGGLRSDWGRDPEGGDQVFWPVAK